MLMEETEHNQCRKNRADIVEYICFCHPQKADAVTEQNKGGYRTEDSQI